MSSYRRYYLPSVSWSDVKGGVWRIQPYNVTDYFFIFRVQNLLTSATGRRDKQAELGQKAEIEENPPKPRREKQARLGEKLKNRIFAPTGRKEEKNR